MAPPSIRELEIDPVIPVCLFPAVLHFSKPTKKKRERVRNRFVKGKLTRERERKRAKREQWLPLVLPRVFFLCYRLKSITYNIYDPTSGGT